MTGMSKTARGTSKSNRMWHYYAGVVGGAPSPLVGGRGDGQNGFTRLETRLCHLKRKKTKLKAVEDYNGYIAQDKGNLQWKKL